MEQEREEEEDFTIDVIRLRGRRMVPLSDAIYLSISSIAGDDLRHNCLWPIACPVPGKISELRVYGFIRFIRNPTCAFAYFER